MRDRPSVIKRAAYCERKFGDLGRVQSYVLESRRTRGCREYTPFWMASEIRTKRDELSPSLEKRAENSAGELIGIQFTIKRFNFSRNEFRSIQLNPVTCFCFCLLLYYFFFTRVRRGSDGIARVQSTGQDRGAALSSTRSTYVHIYLN